MCRTSSHAFVLPLRACSRASTIGLEAFRRGRFEEPEESGSGVRLASRRLCVMGDGFVGRDISIRAIQRDEVVVELGCVFVCSGGEVTGISHRVGEPSA